MCYNASQLAQKIYKDATRMGASKEELDELFRKWKELEKQERINYYHAAGFAHPKLLAFDKKEGKLGFCRIC